MLSFEYVYPTFIISDEKLEELIVTVVRATNRGVAATRNVTMTEPNWTFGQSIFFAGTILTTIGKGKLFVH